MESDTIGDEIVSIPIEIDTNILSENLIIESNISAEEIIENYLKEYNSNFNIDNYIITKSNCGSICISDGTTRDTEIIDYTLKIGDFYTNSGYSAEIENNSVVAIYDNSVDSVIEETLLNIINDFYINQDTLNLDEIENTVISNNLNSEDEIEICEEDIKFFYNIEENKKYIQVPIISEMDDNIGGKDILKDVILYELD